MGSQLADLRHQSTIDYDSDLTQDNSRYQIAFNETMEKHNLNNSQTYKKVEVLLLQWTNDSSDISSEAEVEKLKGVLEQKFHYHAVKKYLDRYSSRPLQAQVNKIIADFTWEHNDRDTLLIVYYAGHGKPGPIYGQLRLFGRNSPNDPRIAQSATDPDRECDYIVWNRTESLLKATTCNVLEIFDCCYAGTVGLTRGEPSQFEFLAATSPTGLTKRPGPNSFTSALIYALEKLLDSRPSGRFTTAELLYEIKHHVTDFPEDQAPMLFNRHNDDRGLINLHPVRKGNRTGKVAREKGRNAVEDQKQLEEPINPAVEHLNRRVLTVHFDYAQKPSTEQIKDLMSPIMKMTQFNRLGVGIRFGSVQHTTAGRAVRLFARSSKRKQSGRQERYSPEPPTLRHHPMTTLQVQTPSSSSASPASFDFKDSAEKSLGSDVTENTEISDLSEAVGSVEEHEDQMYRYKKRKLTRYEDDANYGL